MIDVEMTIDIQAAGEARAQIEKQIERRLDRAVDRLLERIEQAQILAYTADANPARPSGSTYVRTFDLQQSSEKERTGRTLHNMSGRWSATIPYARKVLGSRSEQDPIHQNRWKSIEDVEAEVIEAAPGIIQEELDAL